MARRRPERRLTSGKFQLWLVLVVSVALFSGCSSDDNEANSVSPPMNDDDGVSLDMRPGSDAGGDLNGGRDTENGGDQGGGDADRASDAGDSGSAENDADMTLPDVPREPCEFKQDSDGDDPFEAVTYTTYDDQGRPLVTEFDQGIDGTIDLRTEVSYEALQDGRERIWTFRDDDVDGTWDYRREVIYSARGEVLRLALDVDGNGDFDTVSTFEYNDSGAVTREVVDRGDDGQPDSIQEKTYNVQGWLELETFNSDGQGEPESFVAYTYPDGDLLEVIRVTSTDREGTQVTDRQRTVFVEIAGGRQPTLIEFYGNDDEVDRRFVYEYDDKGGLTLERREVTVEGEWIVQQEVTIETTYDDQDRPLEVRRTTNGDGFGESVVSVQTLSYNDRGQVIEERQSTDGMLVFVRRGTYDQYGRQITEWVDSDGDGQADSRWEAKFDNCAPR